MYGLTRSINGLSVANSETLFAIYWHLYRNDVRTYVNYGRTLYDRNFKHKSVQVLTDAARKYPNDAISHQALAIALFSSGDREGGINEIKIAQRLDPISMQIENELNMMQGTKPNQ